MDLLKYGEKRKDTNMKTIPTTEKQDVTLSVTDNAFSCPGVKPAMLDAAVLAAGYRK